VSDPIPGWRLQPAGSTDPGRRPIGELVAAAGQSYRAHIRSMLAISAVVEGTMSLATLPVMVGQLSIVLSSSTLGTSGSTVTVFRSEFGDVGTSIATGLASIAPILSYLLITFAASAILVASGNGNARLEDALHRLRQRWRSILGAVALVLLLNAVLIWADFAASSAANADADAGSATISSGTHALIALALSVITIIWTCALLYLAVRWAAAAPALVIERLGLVPALDRSDALTRHRRRFVGLVLLTAWTLYSMVVAVSGLLAVAVFLVLGASWPLSAIPAVAVYVVGRVLAAPLGPLISAHLYRALRDAGPVRPQPIGR
jgi:hypothetical protein